MNAFKSYLAVGLKFLLDTLYPLLCFSCGKYIESRDEVLCSTCLSTLVPVSQDNLISEVTFHNGLDAVYAGWYYNRVMHDVIHSMKYGDCAKLGFMLGKKMGQVLQVVIDPLPDVLTAVPLHPVKNRERGYNQAEWITRGLSRSLGIPADFSFLIRRRYTVSQTFLTSAQRLENVKQAFYGRRQLHGEKIGIVDDVLTTGSTVSACALVLKAAGAGSVTAITCSTPKSKQDQRC